ncbi:MAG TPA: hypothetical protein VH575_31055 [Gemmataceae bacterium]|jgi:hypothetical protein
MIPIPVVWTKYTATVRGRVLKLVPCESCATEYVYVLEREGEGVGTSVYLTNEGGAADHAVAAADETLHQYLENDFDPVPCPACGQYQRYMFPKLLETQSPWAALAMVAALLAGAISAVSAVYWGLIYLGQPTETALWRLGASCAVLAAAGLVGVGLSAAERARVRRFDPNTGDRRTRIEAGRRRAVTRAEFEAGQLPPHLTEPQSRPSR